MIIYDIYLFIELNMYINWVLETTKKKEPYPKPTKVIQHQYAKAIEKTPLKELGNMLP